MRCVLRREVLGRGACGAYPAGVVLGCVAGTVEQAAARETLLEAGANRRLVAFLTRSAITKLERQSILDFLGAGQPSPAGTLPTCTNADVYAMTRFGSSSPALFGVFLRQPEVGAPEYYPSILFVRDSGQLESVELPIVVNGATDYSAPFPNMILLTRRYGASYTKTVLVVDACDSPRMRRVAACATGLRTINSSAVTASHLALLCESGVPADCHVVVVPGNPPVGYEPQRVPVPYAQAVRAHGSRFLATSEPRARGEHLIAYVIDPTKNPADVRLILFREQGGSDPERLGFFENPTSYLSIDATNNRIILCDGDGHLYVAEECASPGDAAMERALAGAYGGTTRKRPAELPNAVPYVFRTFPKSTELRRAATCGIVVSGVKHETGMRLVFSSFPEPNGRRDGVIPDMITSAVRPGNWDNPTRIFEDVVCVAVPDGENTLLTWCTRTRDGTVSVATTDVPYGSANCTKHGLYARKNLAVVEVYPDEDAAGNQTSHPQLLVVRTDTGDIIKQHALPRYSTIYDIRSLLYRAT
jgi:hypothetical protein